MVSFKWVYIMKLNPDGTLARLNALQVANWYFSNGVDCNEIFVLVAKTTSVHLSISL